MVRVSQLRSSVRRRIVQRLTESLTKPLRTYEQRIPNSLPALKGQLRPGDVILVEGDQRVSQVIRYLTQSSWSHSALYVGDELRRFKPAVADTLLTQHGAEARHLLIEATVEVGVACTPIAKYAHHNLRVCRPRGLRREDLDRIVEELVGQLGRRYNVRHIVDLSRYFFPLGLIPRRFRRAALHYGGNTTHRVICSTMLARAFANVGFPILPRVTIDQIHEQVHWMRRMLGRNGHGQRALYREEDPAMITPRDFDLSPYFDVIKFNHLANGKFDYRRIEWARDNGHPPPEAPGVALLGNGGKSKASAA